MTQSKRAAEKPVPRWTTKWPDWFGIFGNTEVVPGSDYDALELALARRDALLRECMRREGGGDLHDRIESELGRKP